jgi:hypothetical protein
LDILPGSYLDTKPGCAPLNLNIYGNPDYQIISGLPADIPIFKNSNIDSSWFGMVGDDYTDDTAAYVNFIAAIRAKGGHCQANLRPDRIYRFKPTYLTDYAWRGAIELVDVNELQINGNGAQLKQIIDPTWTANSAPYNAEGPLQFRYSDTVGKSLSNITICNLKVIGDYVPFVPGAGPGQGDGNCEGIIFRGGQNCNTINCEVTGWGTDGIYLGRTYSDISKGSDSLIFNCICDGNRRQGLSIVGFDHVKVFASTFKNTDNGTSSSNGFQHGIDIEPNVGDLVDIRIIGNKFYNNTTGSISILDGQDVLFEGNYCEELNQYCSGTVHFNGTVAGTGAKHVLIINNKLINRVAALYTNGNKITDVDFSHNESYTKYLPNDLATIRINPFSTNTNLNDIKIHDNKFYGTGGVSIHTDGECWFEGNIFVVSKELSSSANCYGFSIDGAGKCHFYGNSITIDTTVIFTSKLAYFVNGESRENHFTSHINAPIYFQSFTSGQTATHGHNWYSTYFYFKDESGNTNLSVVNEGTPLYYETGEYGQQGRVFNGGYHRTLYGVNHVVGDKTFSSANIGISAGSRIIDGYVCFAAGSPGTWRPMSSQVIKGTAPAYLPTMRADDTGVQFLDTASDPDGYPVMWNGTKWVYGLSCRIDQNATTEKIVANYNNFTTASAKVTAKVSNGNSIQISAYSALYSDARFSGKTSIISDVNAGMVIQQNSGAPIDFYTNDHNVATLDASDNLKINLGDLKILTAGKGTILKNAAGTLTRRVRLNDTGDGLLFDTI